MAFTEPISRADSTCHLEERDRAALPSSGALRRASSLLGRATLVQGDFERVLDRVGPGDFVYLDPPFSVSHRRVFKEYSANVFGWSDIVRLRKRLGVLSQLGISFVVSYIESPEAEYLAKGFHVSTVSVRRNIAGFLGSRAVCQELLISNLP